MTRRDREGRGETPDDDLLDEEAAAAPGRRARTDVAARAMATRPPVWAGTSALGEALAKRNPGAPGAVSQDDLATLAVEQKGPGRPLDGRVRERVEGTLGAGLGDVRVHDDPLSREATAAIGARAFAHGVDVFLGAGERGDDLELMAHELTHVVQQTGGAPLPQYIGVGGANTPAEQQADAVAGQVASGQAVPGAALIVDGAPQAQGQMAKAEFLAALKDAVTSAANDALGPMWSAVGCPYIEKWFASHSGDAADALDRMAKRYSGLAQPASARDYIPPICARLSAGIHKWRDGGDVSADLAATGMAPGAVPAATAPGAGGAQPKLAVGGGATPEQLADELGPGQPLDSGTHGRMGEAFGRSFADVRVHTDAAAQRKASELGAVAFAVGNDIGFAPGRYAPGTPVGDALLAHELAHVAQQQGAAADPEARKKPIGEQSGAAEANADAVAKAVVTQQHGKDVKDEKRADIAAMLLSTGYQLQRCTDDSVPSNTIETKTKGKWEGQEVATQKTTVYSQGLPASVTFHIKAGRSLGDPQTTEGAAVALVRTNGKPGAVTAEGGKFVAYTTDLGFGPGGWSTGVTSSSKDEPLQLSPGVVAMIDNGGLIIRPGANDQTGTTDQQMKQTGDPFQGYKDALAGGKGLDSLPDDKLLAAFDAALQDTAFSVLVQAENDVKQRQSKFADKGAGVAQSERDLITQTAKDLLPAQQGVEEAEQAKEAQYAMMRTPGGGEQAMKFQAKAKALDQKWRPQRNALRAKYPQLARFDTAAKLEEFTKKPQQEQVEILGGQLPGILSDIATTRQNIIDHKIELWESREIVEATIAGLGVKDPTKRAVITKKQEEKAKAKTITTVVKAIISMGLGIGAAIVGGPVGVAMAAGALGLDLADAVHETDDYFVKKAATNTAIDPNKSILDPSQAPGWGWLILAWGAVILDLDGVKGAVKAIEKGEKSVAQAADDLAKAHPGTQGLDKDGLVKKLREAAGELGPTEKISEANKGGLASRLGIGLEIDKTVGDTAVKIDYKVNAESGKIEVTGMRVGPGATLSDILAHQEVLKLMRRYEGVSGKIREVFDRLVSLATGKPMPGVNPFPPGSEAFNSWLECKKLPDIIKARTDALGKAVSKEQEALLRQDIDFLENELKRHEGLVERMSHEPTALEVAKPDNPTAKLTRDGGYELPDLKASGKKPPYSVEDMTSSAYYYRMEDGKPILQRKGGQAGLGSKTPEIGADGKPTGKFLEGNLSREEKAEQIVNAFPKDQQDAFKKLVEDLAKTEPAAKVVPVEGIHATGKTIRQLTKEFGNPDFESKLTKLFMDALEKRIASGDLTAKEAKGMVDAAVKNLMDHEITVIQGTDQLRAFNYRGRFKTATGIVAEDDLHHIVPLYLGGEHVPGEAKKIGNLIDLPGGDGGIHDQVHALCDSVKYNDKGVTLAPHSIQNAFPDMQKGAAILHADGTVEFKALGGGGGGGAGAKPP